AWTPTTTILMILGFVVFWPLGLAMLVYILWGDRLREEFSQFHMNFHRSASRCGGFSTTGNTAFDEYRKVELERLAEERAQLDRDRAEFETFVAELRRAKDQDEFDRFMNARKKSKRTS
ncbi:MAG: DUF2852 domain-containing protein, partial [Alphaproteobacteria bacterium]